MSTPNEIRHRTDVHHVARNSLASKLTTLTPDEARELAKELDVAMIGQRLAYIRTLHALEQLGVKWPEGLR